MGTGGTACPKPLRGSTAAARNDRKRATKAYEDEQKRIVRLRDKRCRWPHCTTRGRLEVAHLDAKGMGGDHGVRSSADQMVLLCFWHHQADPQPGHEEGSIERHTLKIEPLTPEGSHGPCVFSRQDADGRWYVVAEERSIGVYVRD